MSPPEARRHPWQRLRSFPPESFPPAPGKLHYFRCIPDVPPPANHWRSSTKFESFLTTEITQMRYNMLC